MCFRRDDLAEERRKREGVKNSAETGAFYCSRIHSLLQRTLLFVAPTPLPAHSRCALPPPSSSAATLPERQFYTGGLLEQQWLQTFPISTILCPGLLFRSFLPMYPLKHENLCMPSYTHTLQRQGSAAVVSTDGGDLTLVRTLHSREAINTRCAAPPYVRASFWRERSREILWSYTAGKNRKYKAQ